MTQAPRTVTVLGSTGSVGTQTVDLLNGAPDRFQVRALVAGRNAALLAQQAIALKARLAVIAAMVQSAGIAAASTTASGPAAVSMPVPDSAWRKAE